MITDVYAHILDEDRKVNAQKFEATFYAKNSVNPLKDVTPPENGNSDLANLISALEQSPELVAILTKALKQKCLRLEGSNFRLGGIAPITRAVPSF